MEPPYDEWDYYETLTVKVTDSFWIEDSLGFQLDGSFMDLHNPVKIFKDSTPVFTLWKPKYWGFYYPGDTISVVLPETISTGNYDEGFSIKYLNDTLKLNTWTYNLGAHEDDSRSLWRIKNIGVVLQYFNFDDNAGIDENIHDSLILFTTPEGQVYP